MPAAGESVSAKFGEGGEGTAEGVHVAVAVPCTCEELVRAGAHHRKPLLIAQCGSEAAPHFSVSDPMIRPETDGRPAHCLFRQTRALGV